MTQAYKWIDTQERVSGSFSAYSEAMGDTLSYPRNWCENATPEELAAVGIEEYTLPAPPPPPPPPEPGTNEYALRHRLEPWQFFAMIEILGKTAAIEQAIAAIPDATQRTVAEARFKHANSFSRDNPLFAQLAPAVGLTDAQIDAAWAQAVAMNDSGGE